MNLKRYVTVTVLITLLSFVISTQAGLTFYTDRSEWAAAVSGDIITEDFHSVSPYVLTEGVNSTGLIDIELTGLVQENEFNFIDDGLAWSGWTHFFHGALRRDDPDAVINLVFRFSVSAFGGDFESTNDKDGLWLEVNGEQYAFGGEESLPSGDGSGFLGFVSTETFPMVTLFDPTKGGWRLGESFGLDNVSFTVPEPVTIVLLGMGGQIFQKRRRYKLG